MDNLKVSSLTDRVSNYLTSFKKERIPFEVDSSVAEAWCPACTTCGESSRRPPPGPDQGDPRQDH